MSHFNFRVVSRILGLLLYIEAAFMLLSSLVSIYYKGNDINAFILSSVITAFSGFLFVMFGRTQHQNICRREGFFVVAISWIIFSFFGMLPFIFSGSIPRIVDAYFETMSGFTTTGASILPNIESLPHGILFWRSLIQWLGGMGIIVFTLALLPILNTGGGNHLFQAEVPGIKPDKLKPRIKETAKHLWLIYTSITILLAGLLAIGPMSLFDAICHSFTTMATGGFSTKQASIAHWNSAYIEYIITGFMFVAGINFTLVYYLVEGKPQKLWKNEEFRWYLKITVAFTIVVAVGLLLTNRYTNIEDSFRIALFQIVSIITTTGFATADYATWGTFSCILIFIAMFSGACAGSTSGGIKIVRLVIMTKNTFNEFFKQIHPNAVRAVNIDRQVIGCDLLNKVFAFITLYIFIIFGSTLLIATTGLTFDESFASSVTCISNVGPGLGITGPAGNFSTLTDFAKWVLSFVMLIGRLELFTIFVLFTSIFWKK